MWDTVKHSDNTLILEYSWPQRHLYHVTGETEDGSDVDFYVWSDSPDDACESVLDYLNIEGSDDSGLNVRELDGALYDAVKETTDKALKALDDE